MDHLSRTLTALVAVFTFSFFLSCQSRTGNDDAKPSNQQGRSEEPELDYSPRRGLGLNEEQVPEREREVLEGYAREFLRVHERQQKQNEDRTGTQGIKWRGMHAKGHGCLPGKMVVSQNLPNPQGIFQPGASYRLTGRFSNGSGLIAADRERDLRGLAVKLEDVPGTPLLSTGKQEQDFLFTNAERHHAAHIVDLMGFIKASAAGGQERIQFLARHPRMAATLLSQTSRNVRSLADESYWSRSAFRYGDNQAVRFFVKPCTEPQNQQGDREEPIDPDFLNTDLIQRASQENICFTMHMQPQVNPRRQRIEIHNEKWRTPAVELATITFERQAPERSPKCEALSFNPWHGVNAHRPLGNFNRARCLIYQEATNFRTGTEKVRCP